MLENLKPVRYGGEMVEDVRVRETRFATAPLRFEAGTPNYVGAIGLSESLKYIERVGRAEICSYEHKLIEHVVKALSSLDGVEILGRPAKRAGCVSFAVKDVHPFDLATLADKLGLALRSGNQCAQPLLYEAYDVQNIARLSPAFYNLHEEVEQAAEILQRVISILQNARR